MADLPPNFVEAMARLRQGPRIELVIKPLDAFFLVSMLQLALRHPYFPARMRYEVVRVTKRLQEFVATQEPALGPYLEMGWDRGALWAKDVPA